MSSPAVVVVGGGIAGASMATVLARSGVRVVVLERQRAFRDCVRGEYLAHWGVEESQELKLSEIFEAAGAIYPRWMIPYDETRCPEVAEASRGDMSQVLPNVPGPLCAGHPASCEALLQAAEIAGASVIRGVAHVHLTEPGRQPEVTYELNGVRESVRPRLVIGADGRNSTIRAEAGIPLHSAPATHLITGMLVEGVPDWPQDTFAIGTQGDVMYYVFPQGEDRVRLYCCTALDQRDRFAGPTGPSRFLETFRGLSALPQGPAIADATPIGPCATLTGEDTWTDDPFADAVALVGDAAGYNDPILGQGLSLALRDVRQLSSLLLEDENWSPERLKPYAEERRERMRRMRFTATLQAALASEFGPAAAARRKRYSERVKERCDPQLPFALAAMRVGPDRVPAFAFEDAMRRKVLE